MKKNIEKIIILVVILFGVVFAWKLKNKDTISANIENNNMEQDSEEIQQELKKNAIGKIEEPKNEEQELEKIEEPKNEEQETEKIEEPKNEDEEPERIEDEKVNQEPDVNDSIFDLVVTSIDLEALKSYKLPILIDFGADGCMPCKMMEPALQEANSELRGKAIIKFVDVWQYPEAAEGFKFSLIPTQFYFDKEGNLQGSHTGALTKEEIVSILKEMGMEE